MKKFILSALSVILFISCTSNVFTGVGTAVDVESPFLTIEEPSNFSYVSGDFIIRGTASDNVAVTKVVVRIERNKKLIKELNAALSGNKWSAKLSGLSDGEYSITVNAHDKAGNSSRHSFKGIVITVDSTPPEVKVISPALKTIDELKEYSHLRYEDIVFFQNQKFTVSGEVAEYFKLKSVELSLIDTEGSTVYKRLIDDKTDFINDETVSGSLFNWSIVIDSQTEIEGAADDSTKYYYDVHVKITDSAGNQVEGSHNYVCVFQDADIPWVTFDSLTEERQRLNAGSLISGNVYDDDYIKSCEWEIKSGDNIISSGILKPEGKPGIMPWSASAPNDPGIYTIKIKVTDANDKYSIHDKEFEVIDTTAPFILADALPEYEYLVSKNGDFTISGYSFDNSALVSTILAWFPSGISANAVKGRKWDITSDGFQSDIKYWILELSLPVPSVEEDGYKGIKRRWSKTLNVYNDFTLPSGEKEFKDKNMYIYAQDDSGKYYLLQVLIPGDKVRPELAVSEPANESNVRNLEGDRFTIKGTVSDYTGIDRVEISNNNEIINAELSGEKWSITSDKFVKLSGGVQNFDVTAYDLYGNTSRQRLTLNVDNDRAYTTSVTSSLAGNATYNSGIIDIVVKMNKPVTVTGNPRIRLNSAENVYADYTSISGDKLELTFTYNLVPGHNADPLDFFDEDSLELNGGDIKDTSTGFDANLSLPNRGSSASLAAKRLKVDTTAPFIKRITSSNADGIYKAPDKIEIVVTMSEIVSVSGTPSLALNFGGKSASYKSGSGTDTLTFEYTVVSSDNVLRLDAESVTGDIKDIAGNLLSETLPKGETEGSLKKNKNIRIDTDHPEFVSVTTDYSGLYAKENDIIDIKVRFNEPVFVLSPESTIKLNPSSNPVGEYLSGSGSDTLVYRYVVSGGDNAPVLAYKLEALTGDISDEAGNKFTSALSGTLNKSVVVDTLKPVVTSLSSPAGEYFNTNQTVTITGGESDLRYRYSLNNGVTWSEWSSEITGDTHDVTTAVSSGSMVSFSIIAMVKDRAGNESDISSPVNFTVDMALPSVKRVSSDTPDGTYKPGDVIQVTVEFNKPVEGSGEITLTNGGKAVLNATDLTYSITGNYTAGSLGSNEDTVNNSLVFKASSLTGTFTDRASNTSSVSLTADNFTGKNIKIDTKAPVLNSHTPAANSTNISDGTAIVLNFNEPVKRESGVILLERKYKTFPAVMSVADYNIYLNRVKSIIPSMETDFVNSYELGLNGTVGGVTDLIGKYILKYAVDHAVTSTIPSSPETGTEKLLKIFNDIGYNRIQINVQSTQLSISGSGFGNTVTITPFNKLPIGIDWTITVPSGAFSDGAGNPTSAVSWDFTTGPAAAPVIRINKQTGNGDTQPFQTHFKLSSETYNAALTYILASAGTPNLNYTAPVQIGVSNSAGQIIHIRASASRAAAGGNTAINTSAVSYEIGYKTRITGDVSFRYIRGSDGDGGPSSSPQFPLSWYNTFTAPMTNGSYHLVTWYINKPFQFKRVNGATGSVTWQGGNNIDGAPGINN